MKRSLLGAVAAAASVTVAVSTAVAVGNIAWRRETRRCMEGLAPSPKAAACFSRDDIAGLPAPVVRYFEFALTDGPLPYWRGHITDSRFEFCDARLSANDRRIAPLPCIGGTRSPAEARRNAHDDSCSMMVNIAKT